jgi:hypothetical protein
LMVPAGTLPETGQAGASVRSQSLARCSDQKYGRRGVSLAVAVKRKLGIRGVPEKTAWYVPCFRQTPTA